MKTESERELKTERKRKTRKIQEPRSHPEKGSSVETGLRFCFPCGVASGWQRAGGSLEVQEDRPLLQPALWKVLGGLIITHTHLNLYLHIGTCVHSAGIHGQREGNVFSPPWFLQQFGLRATGGAVVLHRP